MSEFESQQPEPETGEIAERNLEQLLGKSYRPEQPDPQFVARVTEKMQAVARGELEEPAATCADRDANQEQAPPLPTGLKWALAAAVLVGAFFWWRLPNRHVPRGEPRVARIEGESEYVQSEAPIIAALQLEDIGVAKPSVTKAGFDRLVARPREVPPSSETSVVRTVGTSLQTAHDQQRRITLSDGSVLFVNADTQVSITGERSLELASGEIYLEVSPRTPAAEPTDDHATFTVRTPTREVQALGTRFAVRADHRGTEVTVTQGKVRVSGFDDLVYAGQQLQLAGDRTELTSAPRASHVLAWTADLVTAAEGALVPASDYGGGALVTVDPNGQEARLSLRKFHVDVYIEDGFARTTIDQTYFNHMQSRQEGTFYFPLPPDASLSRLAMYVGGIRMEGGMVERDYGRNVFEEIVRRQKDPALLEWVDGSTFKMRVFPLEPREEKRIILSYTQRLTGSYGRMTYRFPAGHNLETVGKWSTQLRVVGGAEQHWSCPSHELTAVQDHGDLLLTAAAERVTMDHDLVLVLGYTGSDDWRQTDLPRWSTSSVEPAYRYLMLRYRPQLEGRAKFERRDWVFLFESSGDRDPLLARVQIDVVRTLLENAQHDDTFSIVTAATRVQALARQPQPCTPDNVSAAIARLEQTHLVGALDLGQGLAAAATFCGQVDNPYLVHVGSGVPILGERRQEVLIASLPKARYVGVGVGKRWNRSLMRNAAAKTGGHYTQINPDEPVAWRGYELLATLNAPRLLDVSLADPGDRTQFLLFDTSLVQGDELCAVARLPRNARLPQVVTLQGTLDGRAYREKLRVSDVDPHADYLPRTWAKLEIDRLVAENAQQNKDQIVKLSKAMYVISPFTSLLVLENEAMYEQFHVDRGRSDHWALYPAPDKIPVVYEPLVGPQPQPEATSPASEEPNAEPKKTAADVLATIVVRDGWHGGLDGDRVQPYQVFGNVLDSGGVGGGFGGRTMAGSQADFDALIDLITSTVAPETWEDAGRPGRVQPFPTHLSLVIRQTQQVHRQPLDLPLIGFSTTPSGHFTTRWPPNLNHPLANALDAKGVIDEQYPSGSYDGYLTNWFEFLAAREGRRGKYISTLLTVDEPSVYDQPRVRQSGLHVEDYYSHLNEAGLRRIINMEKGRVGVHGFEPDQQSTPSGQQGFSFWRSGWLAHEGNTWGGLPLRGATRSEEFEYTFNPYPIEIVTGETLSGLDQTAREAAEALKDIQLAQRRYREELGPLQHSRDKAVRRQLRYLRHLFAKQGDSGGESDQTKGHGLPIPFYMQDEVRYFALGPDTNPQPGGDPYDRQLNEALEQVLAGSNNPVTVIGPHSLLNDLHETHGDYEEWQLGYQLQVPVGLRERLASARYAQLRDMRGVYHAFQVSGDALFRNLLAYAPGLHTMSADVLATVEAETGDDVPAGKIDPRAAELIDRARGIGFRQVTFANGRTITFDGTGRFRTQRSTTDGLVEVVACNGTTLWHTYDEIGLGARRTVSRYHRRELAAALPWLVLPAEDLARGCDLVLRDPQTVAIVPHAEDHDPALAVELVFDDANRLAERRLVWGPERRRLLTQTLSPGGTLRWFNRHGRMLAEVQTTLTAAAAPDVQPASAQLVVLPFPIRDYQHTVAGTDFATTRNYEQLDEATALALLGNYLWSHDWDVFQLLARRFFARGDRRPGFFTLLQSTWGSWDREMTFGDKQYSFNPQQKASKDPLARYLAWFSRPGDTASQPYEETADQGPLLKSLTRFHNVLRDEAQGDWTSSDDDARQTSRRRALQFAAEKATPDWMAWQVALALCRVESIDHEKLLAVLERFTDDPRVAYFARYERARVLSRDSDAGSREFDKWYRQCLAAGVLPAVDDDFRTAFANWNRRDQLLDLLRFAHQTLNERYGPGAAVPLAWQCRQLDEPSLGAQFVEQSLEQLGDRDRLVATLGAVAYLAEVDRKQQAGNLLDDLLSRTPYRNWPALWRLSATLASQQGYFARAVAAQERAANLDFAAAGQVVNLETFRQQSTQLFQQYEQLARALASPNGQGSEQFIDRVIGAADRWRKLDPDRTQACQAAAVVLQLAGATELAWDYATTPLADRPNEAEPWLSLAHSLRDNEQVELADRAYRLAWSMEETNAQILWEHAQFLSQQGRLSEARRLYAQLANGKWQPRFEHLQQNARKLIGR